MNETSSGVAISAAKIRSPSFSRSSSSTTTTALPALRSATARSIGSKPSARIGSGRRPSVHRSLGLRLLVRADAAPARHGTRR